MDQLNNPTAKDWVSQVLEELEDLSINYQIEEIEAMKKTFFKNIVKEAIKKKAFDYLMEKKRKRTSDNAKGKQIIYHNFTMADYLCPSDEEISIEEKIWLFKCRVEDINVKGNHRWKHNDLSCFSCKKGMIETQTQILYCDTLLGKNENVTFIPQYEELYSEDLREQVYVSRLLKEHFENRVPEI